MIDRVIVKCKKCDKARQLGWEYGEKHYLEKCEATYGFFCKGKSCKGIFFQKMEDLIEKHWKIDCPDFIYDCKICHRSYKEKVHSCVKALKDELFARKKKNEELTDAINKLDKGEIYEAPCEKNNYGVYLNGKQKQLSEMLNERVKLCDEVDE